ncbi:heparinase II/III domain-containing protein [Chitinophaga vietnamensis]|uniref:heparinase II/III domain-containing protein n=1 Tax=Chitinophaga vietnamensis TaxID=2593957 RepID=UPI0013761CDC|nr:heparinase II/III family protein [Chitinophaga vietnamensis]
MKLKRIVFHVCLLAGMAGTAALRAQGPAPRNYLYQEWQHAGGEAAFSQVDHWKQSQYHHILQQVDALPAAVRATLAHDADQAMSFTWPALTAALYLQFRDNGNRTNYENAQFERRKVLSTLVAGELATRNGRYIPQIVNGLWAILEESSWVLPAHVGAQKAGTDLPDPNEQIVDLFAGETAATVAWTQFLLHDALDKYSPIINKRINYELQRRIVEPFLQRNDFWWMGFQGNHTVNNWNVWINTNVLETALLSVTDTDTRNKVIEKTIRSADNFVNAYPEDGGCDEGPSYWGHAGGKLIELLSWLHSASQQRLDWSHQPLIHEIGAYIYKMHVDANRFVNFADASAINIPPPHTVYLYGQLFQDALLKRFAAYLYHLDNPDTNKIKAGSLPFFVYDVLLRDSLLQTTPAAPYTTMNWLPGLQVLSLRSQPGMAKGLFFAAQGGHNAESHNHNDVGNFVLYMDGKPAIIDVGVGTYTKQTFSADRYKLWYMQSQWHNCPTINGVQQKDGRQFQAKDVHFSSNKQGQVLQMDIAAAYPETAMVARWQRTFTFTPANASLQLDEDYALKSWNTPYLLHFMTCLPADTSTPGKIILKGEGTQLTMTYAPALFTVITEQQSINDARLSPVWGSSVTRISLRARQQQLTGKHTITFTQGR